MAFEEIKAGLAKYTADVEAKLVKNPERANLVPNRLYTPIDLGENFDYRMGFLRIGTYQHDHVRFLGDILDRICHRAGAQSHGQTGNRCRQNLELSGKT